MVTPASVLPMNIQVALLAFFNAIRVVWSLNDFDHLACEFFVAPYCPKVAHVLYVYYT